MTASLSIMEASEPQRAEVAVPIVSAKSDTLAALMFAVKTYLAALLALFISFWLTLDEPYWALLTVFVVAQPDSGLVLAKGFYRILGTAAGVLMTVALVFAFAQYGELFIASLAVWIGVCNFAARAVRNFASYGFQLAGYTVAIIGIPAALNPNEAYPIILARATEISLGIGCMALVSRLIGPRELAPKLVALVRELICCTDRFAEAAMNPATTREQLTAERAALAKDFGTVEAMRSSAFFESADVRLLNEPLQRATYAAVELYAAAEGAPARLGAAVHAVSPQDPGASISNTEETPRENVEVISALLRAADERAVASARVQLGEAKIALDRGTRVAGPNSCSLALVGLCGGGSDRNSSCTGCSNYDGLLVRNGLAERSYCGHRCGRRVHPPCLDGAAGEDHVGSCGNHSCRRGSGIRDAVPPSALCLGLRLDGSGTCTPAAGMRLHHCATWDRPAWPPGRGLLRGRLAYR